MSLTTKVKVAKFSFLNEKSYNKTVIDFNFGRHKDLSTLKSDFHFFGSINSYVYLIEVNNCKLSSVIGHIFVIWAVIFIILFFQVP